MNRSRAFVALSMTLLMVTLAKSGHELPVYPSFYPHEIEIAAVAPEPAAALLQAGKIQAYVGRAPRFAGAPSATIDSIASLGMFVTVRVNPSSPRAGDARSACAIAKLVTRDLAGKSADLISHPYPVTPFHGDYLHHADLAEAAKATMLESGPLPSDSATQVLRVKANSEFGRSLVRPAWLAAGSEWDVEIAEVSALQLVADARIAMNGWLGPPWLRTGWFQAYVLLREQTVDADLKQRIESQAQRAQTTGGDDMVERINLERSLVSTLADNCYARIAGYTIKREYFSTIFTAGIENIAFDALEGINSPIFIRTVKLRDFPWNGWLALGIDTTPEAAWNPIAGFSDSFGRLMWSALIDPAWIPSPNEAGWMINRISEVQSSAKQ